jgi:hypothetical protein
MIAADDPLAVDFQAGQRARPGPGRQHQVPAADELIADADLGGGDEAARPLDHVDPPAGDQAGQALPELVDHRVLVGVEGRPVDVAQGSRNAEAGPRPGLVGDLGRVQQGLGRDAPPVQAGAPDLVLLDQRDPLPQLARPQRARIAAAAAAEDDDVVAVLTRSGHVCSAPR